MANRHTHTFEHLRRRAEHLLGAGAGSKWDEDSPDIAKTLHELQVHQVELEMQNEELLRTQAELVESRDRYFELYDLAPVGYLTLDQQWRVLESNITAASWLGTERSLLIGKPLSRYLKETEAVPFHFFKQKMQREGGRQRFEGWFQRRNGEAIYGLLEMSAIVSAGNNHRYRCILVDLTARRSAEDKLQDREQRLAETSFRLSQITERIDDVFYVMCPDSHKILYASPAFEALFGRPLHSAGNAGEPGDSWLRFIHPADRERVERAIKAAAEGVAYAEDYRIVRPDGSVRLVQDRCFPSKKHPELTGIIHDVTEERQVQEQLRRAQRMESLGTLASGIAHDFNNLLMGITGYAHLALQVLDPSHPAYGFIYRSLGSTMRGASLTRRLVSFGDQRGHDAKAMLIDRVLSNTKDLIHRLVGDHIHVHLNLGAHDIAVPGDAGEMEQVLMNLAGNARDAMENGGTLTIATSQEAPVGNDSGKAFVAIRVQDTGSGMSEETLAHIFEPFFTTKEMGKGTGLGLATVFSVVRRLGGEVAARSEQGHGTEFTLYLPVVDELPNVILQQSGQSEVSGNGECILVVDDDPLVCTTVEAYLQSLNYRVLLCGDSAAALRLCHDKGAAIDLMITDIMMPGRLGGDLARELRSMCPQMRVLFMSAHPPQDLHRLGRLEKGAPLLTKPFDVGMLGLAVHKALKENTTAASLSPETQGDHHVCDAAKKQHAVHRILIVDDDPDVADSLRLFLEFEGQKVAVAYNGAQAIELAKSFRPSVVLCDLNLGATTNGYEVAEALRHESGRSGMYMVALTGSDADTRRERAQEAGFDDIVTKPIDLSRLEEIIQQPTASAI